MSVTYTIDKPHGLIRTRCLRDSVRFGTCAIVVGTDAWFGTAQVFEVLAARNFSATKVFREVAAAETWLEDQRSTA